jgi:hypothetical protein
VCVVLFVVAVAVAVWLGGGGVTIVALGRGGDGKRGVGVLGGGGGGVWGGGIDDERNVAHACLEIRDDLNLTKPTQRLSHLCSTYIHASTRQAAASQYDKAHNPSTAEAEAAGAGLSKAEAAELEASWQQQVGGWVGSWCG